MKHFISKDKYINAVVSNAVDRPDTLVCPFTISIFAKAFNISRTTAAKRISLNKDIIEVSSSGGDEPENLVSISDERQPQRPCPRIEQKDCTTKCNKPKEEYKIGKLKTNPPSRPLPDMRTKK